MPLTIVRLLKLCLLWLIITIATPSSPLPAHSPTGMTTTTVTYTNDTRIFANPERGFYRHLETHSHQYDPLNLNLLRQYRQEEHVTLILRMFYLRDFVYSDISDDYLAQMQADFDTLRRAGQKAIVRFAYSNQVNNTPRDASKAQILRHLAQLEPILQANQDVIAVVQASFIGVWGEWYYTDHFVDDPTRPWLVSPAQYAHRLDILTTILDIMPPTTHVQIRYPHAKQIMFGNSNPLRPNQAFTGQNRARVGYHNDCFLASETDFGTYREGLIAEDKAYVAAETRYVPFGGETCVVNPPRSLCDTAVVELALLHASYLNRTYNPNVLNSWVTGDCWDEIQRRLGYRFALQKGVYSDAIRAGQPFHFDLELHNDGWASPYNPRPVYLLLRHQTSGELHTVRLPHDPRRWLPESGTIRLQHTLCTAPSLPAGQYDLLLHLPDPNLPTVPAYAIRLANAQVWEASTGYNRLLHTVTVQPPSGGEARRMSALVGFCIHDQYLPLVTRP